MTGDLKKYRIDACLEEMTVKENRQAQELFPRLLKISVNTFRNYRNIKLSDHQDIPHEKVRLLEILLGLEPNALLNYEPVGKTFKQIFEELKDIEYPKIFLESPAGRQFFKTWMEQRNCGNIK
ncbi:hypothetical protein [Pedobacter duraquae]|nr:hypothetical protein [Pedobacter duraquae]